ncbi:MAG: M48 family metallopeptidase [Clostridia bacterium]|nr:M48 family metallopeptidase [Clostridia bacterium]
MIFGNAEATVIKSKRKTISIQVKPNEVVIRVPLRMKEKEVEKFVESKRNWIEKHLHSVAEKQKLLQNTELYTEEEIESLVSKAKEIIPQKVDFYADKIGVTYNKITIRCQRTRWGSCSSKGNLNFNCLLVLLPDEIIDSVVVHELCHRKQMNHSAKFYAEIEKVFPDYKSCHAWLNQNGRKYMSRIPK